MVVSVASAALPLLSRDGHFIIRDVHEATVRFLLCGLQGE